jgi:hypothetical protein
MTARARRVCTSLAAGLAIITSACRGMPNTLGTDRRAARANADALFDGLAIRFDNVQRAPKFFQARSKLGRYALSPSGVYGDTSVWTAWAADSTRTLTLSGTHTSAGYLFAPRASIPLPVTTGDSRHVIRLHRLGESEYDWDTMVDHAIGAVRANEVAAALTAFLSAPQQTGSARIRAESQALFPRATRVLGELFSLDTVRVAPLADGSASVLVRFHMHPDGIEKTRPNFAKYLNKYVSPARYRLRMQDGRGAVWLDATGEDEAFTISYRVRDGQMLALAGPARPMPDSLQIAIDFSAKFMIFRVGVSSLVGDFSFIRSADERGWMTHFRHEPDWHFPLAVNNLIRTSLRRPFAGDGMMVRISFRDRSGSQALLSRQAGVAVQESAIVRWLGGLGNSAMSDFAGRAEAEENRYVFEVLSALRGDFVAALSGGE